MKLPEGKEEGEHQVIRVVGVKKGIVLTIL